MKLETGIRSHGVRAIFLCGIFGLLFLSGCNQAGSTGQKAADRQNSTQQASNPKTEAVDQKTAEAYLEKAWPVLTDGLKNSEGVDKNSVLKVEGVSSVKVDKETYLWCGTRSVDLNNTGAAVLLESGDGGSSWTFKGRMLSYPTDLQSVLQTAAVYDINRYLQSYTHRADQNGIQIGDFPLSDAEKKALEDSAKTESRYTQPLEAVKSKAQALGFPAGTNFTLEIDHYICTIKGTTYYVFPLQTSEASGAPYYVARVTK